MKYMTDTGGNKLSFKELNKEELKRAAVEDFAVDVEENASADDIRATFLEMGITWADYVAQHPELAPEEPVAPASQFDEEERITEPRREGGVITSKDVTQGSTEPVRVRVKEAPVLAPNDKYLVKMTRANTLYETRGHRFTQENPYALVDASDFEYILEREDGFRQAYPSELQEFYS